MANYEFDLYIRGPINAGWGEAPEMEAIFNVVIEMCVIAIGEICDCASVRFHRGKSETRTLL